MQGSVLRRSHCRTSLALRHRMPQMCAAEMHWPLSRGPKASQGSEKYRFGPPILDDYEFDDVKFLKVDVEGHEAAMIDGAEDTLRRCRPTVLIEIEQGLNDRPISDLFERFESLGYSGWFRRSRQWVPLSTFDLERDQLLLVDQPTACPTSTTSFLLPGGSKPGST